MECPRARAPPAQIYFTTHGSGAVPVLRVRTVVHGEQASGSIVNKTTASWSTIITASLMLAIAGSVSVSV